MPEPESSVPFDPSEFTDEELLAARAFLLARRLISTGPTKPAKVTEGYSWQWCWSERGGQACRIRSTLTQSEGTFSTAFHPPADSHWFDCTREQFQALIAPPPDPDQVVQPAANEQP